MTQEAKVTLLTIERYLVKNPDISLAQALFQLQIIQLNEMSVPSSSPGLRNIYRENDIQILGRVIRSHPFRKQKRQAPQKKL